MNNKGQIERSLDVTADILKRIVPRLGDQDYCQFALDVWFPAIGRIMSDVDKIVTSDSLQEVKQVRRAVNDYQQLFEKSCPRQKDQHKESLNFTSPCYYKLVNSGVIVPPTYENVTTESRLSWSDEIALVGLGIKPVALTHFDLPEAFEWNDRSYYDAATCGVVSWPVTGLKDGQATRELEAIIWFKPGVEYMGYKTQDLARLLLRDTLLSIHKGVNLFPGHLFDIIQGIVYGYPKDSIMEYWASKQNLTVDDPTVKRHRMERDQLFRESQKGYLSGEDIWMYVIYEGALKKEIIRYDKKVREKFDLLWQEAKDFIDENIAVDQNPLVSDFKKYGSLSSTEDTSIANLITDYLGYQEQYQKSSAFG